ACAQSQGSETYRQLNLFGDVFERVRADYVEEVSDEELVEAAINGMLTSLDPHSSYLNQKSFRDMQVQTRGEFGGLGIEVTMEKGYVKVVSPIDDTPAFRRGAQPPFDVEVTRDVIRIQSVRWRREGDLGYIRITSFSEQTEEGLKEAVEELQREVGDDLKGILLDLRNNPGGLLDQAIAVSDAFIDQGEIVSTRGRTKEDAQRYNATRGQLVPDLPMVVLINGGSASASEIVAGALQDHKRALIVGTDSFGKGSVQTIIPIPGHGAIRLTTARYYTPSGRSIQAMGIQPDIEISQAHLEPVQAAISRREADLRGALPGETPDGAQPPATPQSE